MTRFWHLMGDGGWGMWFVLAFGLITLAAALAFAIKPGSGREQPVRAFGRATTFAILSTTSLDLATVGSQVPAHLEWASMPRLPLIVMEGIAESLAPAILGCTLLSLVWLLVAVGQRRLMHEGPVRLTDV